MFTSGCAGLDTSGSTFSFAPEVTDLPNFMRAAVIWDRRSVRLEIGSCPESLAQHSPVREALLIVGHSTLFLLFGGFTNVSEEFDSHICARREVAQRIRQPDFMSPVIQLCPFLL